MNKYVKKVVKELIIFSSMAAFSNTFSVFTPTRASHLVNGIAGASIGYLVGKTAADAVIDGVEHTIAICKGEEVEDGSN